MNAPIKMLVINPGSTSTKVSYFEDEKNIYTESIFHDAPELLKYPTTNDQMPMRKQVLLDFLQSHGMTPADMDVFIGRGGCAYSQAAGVMEIDERLVQDTAADQGRQRPPGKAGRHAGLRAGLRVPQANVHRKPHQRGRAVGLRPSDRHCGALPPCPDPCAEPEGHCRHSREKAGQALRGAEPDRLPCGRRHHRHRP